MQEGTLESFTFRFFGDPTGYQVEQDTSLGAPSAPTIKWQKATVGFTDRTVWINAGMAYMVEQETIDA